MKKTILALTAILSLGLVSCDRDERILEVEKKVEVPTLVDVSSLLEGKWAVKEAQVGNKKVVKASDDECLTKTSLEFKKEDGKVGEFMFNIALNKNGQCTTLPAIEGTYLYDSFQKIVSLAANDDEYSALFDLVVVSENEIKLGINAEVVNEYTGVKDAEDLVLTLTK